MPESHLRMAFQLAAQLPEDVNDARTVLGHLRHMVEHYWPGGDQERPVAVLVCDNQVADSESTSSAPNSASDFASLMDKKSGLPK